jgi:5-methylcytosine-specific restriction endonuclease McrA
LVSHHIIQLQHGGSNRKANLVRICEWCHAAIHPWMTAPALVVDERFRPFWG